MSVVTSQQISKYYELFKTFEITFNKDVIGTTKLNSKEIYIKCLGDQFPVILYSTSMTSAKVIGTVTKEIIEKIKKANNMVSLRFSFNLADKSTPLNFFVAAKVAGFNPYSKENPQLNFITLQYTQRPPDDLIFILGNLLEINVNSKKRTEDRIMITVDSVRKLGFKAKDAKVFIQNIPRTAILRDISFSGARIVIVGVAKFLLDKEAVMHIPLEAGKPLTIPGKIVRCEEVQDRKDLAVIGIQYNQEAIPMEYKSRINDFLKNQTIRDRQKDETAGQ
jgi:Tfp pilus assembly protein PilZ